MDRSKPCPFCHVSSVCTVEKGKRFERKQRKGELLLHIVLDGEVKSTFESGEGNFMMMMMMMMIVIIMMPEQKRSSSSPSGSKQIGKDRSNIVADIVQEEEESRRKAQQIANDRIKKGLTNGTNSFEYMSRRARAEQLVIHKLPRPSNVKDTNTKRRSKSRTKVGEKRN